MGEDRSPRVRLRVTVAIVLLALGAGALLTTGSLHGPGGHARPAMPVVQRSSIAPARVSDVYRFPLGCLGTTIFTTAHGLPPLDHRGPCWRYGVYVTAILHRSRGVWRLALEAISASCPSVSLPLPVRAALAVCRRPTRSDRAPHQLDRVVNR